MKNTVKKEILEKAIELMQIIDRRRELDKQEKAIKDFFKAYCEQEGETALLAGQILIIISEKERTTVDMEKMKADGIELKKYERVTKYKQMDVKRA